MRLRVIIVFAILLVSAGLVARADRSEEVLPRASFDTFPMQIADWRGIQQPALTKAVLDILRADDYLTRSYFSPNRSAIGLYIGYWRSQKQGDTIHSPLNCLPGGGWEFVSRQIMTLAPGQTINRNVIRKGLDRQLVLYWYQSHSRLVASEYWSKFYLVTDAMRSNRTDGAIVRVTAPIVGDAPDAEQRAQQEAMRFVKVLLPLLNTYLPV